MYWQGYAISEAPHVISEARRFLEAHVISGGM